MVAHRPESDLSNLLADIMVWAARDYNEKVDFGVYNMGGIRAALSRVRLPLVTCWISHLSRIKFAS